MKNACSVVLSFLAASLLNAGEQREVDGMYTFEVKPIPEHMTRAGMSGAFCDFKSHAVEDSLFRIICFSDSLGDYLKTQQFPTIKISVSIEKDGMKRIKAIGDRQFNSFRDREGNLIYTFVSKKDSH